MEPKFKALPRQQIINVIEGKGHADRVPVMIHFWNAPYVFGDKEQEVNAIRDQYEEDVERYDIYTPGMFEGTEKHPEYRWLPYSEERITGGEERSKALDLQINIPDEVFEEEIDDIIAKFPTDIDDAAFPYDVPEKGDRYRLFSWWYCFFERHWSLRGMENALTDFYLYPDEVHKLYRALTDMYKKFIKRAAELGGDGIFVSDDIGTQTGPFFSREIFEEFFKPYYKELFDCAHENGMHFWLHTCGNILNYLDDFAEIGLDVIHPLQKYTMDEKEAKEKIDGRICIWGGFDVQQTIPYKTADDVREEVRFMMDTYFEKNGKFMITAGNGITADCPLDSLAALYDECYTYGTKKCAECEK